MHWQRPKISDVGPGVAHIALFVALLLVAVAGIRPAVFGFPTAGLDASWVAAISYAVEKGLAFGSEIVFTSGPLSSLYHRMYPHALAPAIIVLDCVWVAVFVIQLEELLTPLLDRREWRWLFGLFLAGLILLAERFLRDGLMLFFVFAAAHRYTCGRTGPLVMLASIMVIAAFGMAKFSVLVLALPAFVIVDALSVTRREIPYKTAVLVLCLVVAFVAVDQPLSNFPAYLRASLEVSQGYSAGMSIDGAPDSIWLWIAASFAIVAIAAVAAWPAMKIGGPGRATVIAQWLLLIGYLFVLMKAGFVRHDGHSLIAWTGLFLAIPAMALVSGPIWEKYRPFEVTLVLSFLYLYGPYVQKMPLSVLNPAGIAARSIATLEGIADFARRPRGWMAEKEQRFASARGQLHAAAQLPVVSGSVDIIPSRQSEVIAAQLDYRPRPTIQEYITYSLPLIQRNRRFYLSPKAPDFVFFSPGSIDGRHPASAEGALWPLLLQRYEPFQRSSDLLVLRKRAQPLPDLLAAPIDRQARLGDRIEVPPSTAPWFVKIDVQYSPLGRLAEQLLKPPSIVLRAFYAEAPPEDYRLIPGMAREGAILVPTIKTPDMFLRLYDGGVASNSGMWPVAFAVIASWRQSWAYKSDVAVSFAEINADVLRKAEHSAWAAALRTGNAAREER
ncbi:MAG: transrane protein [Bradyrhizobium sp.]|nr:transrane protein [Bradyrhizobium sp.]